MIRLINILFILLFPLINIAQINSFNSKNIFYTNLSDVTSLSYNYKGDSVIIAPQYLSMNSFNKKDIINTCIIGVEMQASIAEKLNLRSRFDYLFLDVNSILANYQDSLDVIPHYGNENYRVQYNFKYSLNKFIDIDFGRGSHMIGNGYRSLLLSHISPYPFLKFTTKFGRVQYYNLYAAFENINQDYREKKKYATLHYLDIKLTNNINIGLFESIIWRSWDGNNNIGFEIGYLNPVIFYRPVEFSMGSGKANALMGCNLSVKHKNNIFYGQFSLDDLNISRQKDRDANYQEGFIQNKFAYQIGMSSKFKKIGILLEYNHVKPYTYGHRSIIQNYSHNNQALAHPFGANFKEFVCNLKYVKNKWSYNLFCNYVQIGLDSVNTHYGQNIFISEQNSSTGGGLSYGNYTTQGVLTNMIIINPELSYKYKYFDIFSSIYYIRKKSDYLNQTSFWYSFGIRTFLFPFFPLVS